MTGEKPGAKWSVRPGSRSAERGLVLPAFALSVAVAFIMATLLVGVAGRAGDRAQAQAVADAVALAGAAGGEAAAQIIADANNASLERFETGGTTVTVAVEINGARAHAAATKQIRPSPPG